MIFLETEGKSHSSNQSNLLVSELKMYEGQDNVPQGFLRPL